jgi:hypothetical protein
MTTVVAITVLLAGSFVRYRVRRQEKFVFGDCWRAVVFVAMTAWLAETSVYGWIGLSNLLWAGNQMTLHLRIIQNDPPGLFNIKFNTTKVILVDDPQRRTFSITYSRHHFDFGGAVPGDAVSVAATPGWAGYNLTGAVVIEKPGATTRRNEASKP